MQWTHRVAYHFEGGGVVVMIPVDFGHGNVSIARSWSCGDGVSGFTASLDCKRVSERVVRAIVIVNV